jgi:propanediol dehydratase small subunit
MARRRILVPEARNAVDHLKGEVMQQAGYPVDKDNPNNVKYEVAKELDVPLNQGYNGHIKAEQAGQIGGNIGGKMVREMIKMAQQSLTKK